MNASLDSAVQFAFSVLLNSLWEGIAIALLCAAILRFTRATNATTRASVLTGALLACAVLPFATAFITIGIHAPAKVSQTSSHITVSPRRETSALKAYPVQGVQGMNGDATVPFRRMQINIPRIAIVTIVGLWLLAALVALVRLTISLLHLERLKHDALPLAVDYRSHMSRWTQASKGGRGVRLCRSPEIAVPIAVGLFDAMILVPETLIEELSPEDVDRILLHELAHLRRGDDWINAIERITQALFFFNPGIQWIVGQLDLEREVVCDDWVLNQTTEIHQYATCLARVAEITAWPYRAMSAPGAFVTRRSMSIRVERLLQAGRDIRTSTSPGSRRPSLVDICCIVYRGRVRLALNRIHDHRSARHARRPNVRRARTFHRISQRLRNSGEPLREGEQNAAKERRGRGSTFR